MTLELRLTLLSDATFGRGDGVPGLVDEEVEYDRATGLPFVRGRTLKGLLVEECSNILFALRGRAAALDERLARAAQFLFGRPGSTLDDDALMHVGPALLPRPLREAVAADVRRRGGLDPAEVLESLTAVRRQTAVDEATGAPDEGSLRSLRVVLRQTTFAARLEFAEPPSADALGLLAACAKGLRRGGMGRNRGRGRLDTALHDDAGNDVSNQHFTHFERLVRGGVS